jgi:hypothetical protein
VCLFLQGRCIACRIDIAESDGLKTKQPSAVFQTHAGPLTPQGAMAPSFLLEPEKCHKT